MLKKINVILYFILIICFILLSFNVLKLGILPIKYLIIYFSILIVLCVIFGLFTFVCKNKVIRLITIVFVLLLSFCSCFVSFVILDKTDDFFRNISEVKESSVYYLISLNGKYKDINDLKDKSVGISDLGVNDSAISLLNSKLKYKKVKYNNILSLYNDLLNGNIDSIYINSNIKVLFDEELDGFSDNTFVIEEFKVKVLENEKVNKKISDDTINIYISGIDTWGSINTVSRSDVNIIMSINQKKKKILLTTIPRDSYVQLHGTSGPKDKLTHAGIYGINMSIDTIEDFIGIDIDYYIRVNFNTLVNVIDTIGGVNVYSDVSFNAGGYRFVKGSNYLDGKKALAFSRARKQFSGGDRVRGQHQQAVITGVVEKVTSSRVLLSNYTNILASLNNTFQSNVDDSIIRDFFKEQLDSMSTWDIKSISVDGTGLYTTSTYSMPGWNLYVMIPNQDTVNYVRNEINNLNK